MTGAQIVVEFVVDRELAPTGPDMTGWRDAPRPAHEQERHAQSRAGAAEEQHR